MNGKILPEPETLEKWAAPVALYSICVFEYRSYLDGATPTKLGPRPLKSERGPSFSSINLRKREKVKNRICNHVATLTLW